MRDFAIPWRDVRGPDGSRNWDHDRRLAELEADGIVAEVVFPNTIPPFYPETSLLMQPPAANEGDLDRRWAGLRAHNRWLADFCSRAPGRRAGHRADPAARRRRRGARDPLGEGRTGSRAASFCPARRPTSGIPPLYAPDYEPIWAVCEELGMPVNHHAGSAVPRHGRLSRRRR